MEGIETQLILACLDEQLIECRGKQAGRGPKCTCCIDRKVIDSGHTYADWYKGKLKLRDWRVSSTWMSTPPFRLLTPSVTCVYRPMVCCTVVNGGSSPNPSSIDTGTVSSPLHYPSADHVLVSFTATRPAQLVLHNFIFLLSFFFLTTRAFFHTHYTTRANGGAAQHYKHREFNFFECDGRCGRGEREWHHRHGHFWLARAASPAQGSPAKRHRRLPRGHCTPAFEEI